VILLRVFMQTVWLAIGQIWSHKVRALLTTLGIVIGVAAVVGTVGTLTGLQETVLGEFEKLGARRIYIDGRLPPQLRNRLRWIDTRLSIPEIEAIRDQCPSISAITPEYWGTYEAISGDFKVAGVPTVGIWPVWHEITGRGVLMGRSFNAIDEEERRLVCMVNEAMIADLNLDREPVGTHIVLAGRRFLIVGVVETVDLAMFGGGDTRAECFIPFSTAKLLRPYGWISHAWAQLASPGKAEDAKAEVSFVLRRMRGLDPNDPDTWEVQVLQQFIDQFNKIAALMTVGAGAVVSISLLVGGIGIMNIMLVSVSERTREIGLRKAIGARPTVILLQFLVESVVLCLSGGAIGLLLGQLMVVGVASIPGIDIGDPTVPVWAIVLAVGFSAGTGVIFGMFPALKAAALNPIDALRHE
jgi:putative ABC transport system permease protein